MAIRFLTAGESHGKQLTVIVEGLPAGIEIDESQINTELKRRQQGYGRGGRMKIEADEVLICSGVRDALTLGSPLTLVIENRDWKNWEEIMTPQKGAKYEKKITIPRPGHADLPGGLKYRQADLRNILERASARETAARVAVGAVCKLFLKYFGIEIYSRVISIGTVCDFSQPQKEDLSLVDESPVRCIDEKAAQKMMEEIDDAKAAGETLGGTFEVIAYQVPLGLGSHIQWDYRLDGKLAQAIMSIPAIKGVEIGDGFLTAQSLGSQAHDIIQWEGKFSHLTNKAGGIEGGITNGEPIRIKAAMKPIPTLMKPLKSIELYTKGEQLAVTERSDVCAVPAAAVIGEAMVAIVLADEICKKFGGDHINETLANFNLYQDYLRQV